MSGILQQRDDFPRVEDVNSAGYSSAVLFVPGAAQVAGRAVGYVCTAAGNATFILAGGSTITIPLVVGGFATLPFAAIEVTLSNGAAGTFWCLS